MSDNNNEPTAEQLEYLVGKALLEPTFRTLFLSDPEVAADSLQIQLTEEQITHIKSLDERVMEDMGDAIDQLADPALIAQWIHLQDPGMQDPGMQDPGAGSLSS